MSTDKEQLVCGEDHVTYNNACEHKKAECEQQTSISIIGNGSCAGKFLMLDTCEKRH